MAFKAFVVMVALCLVSMASAFVAPSAFSRNGECGCPTNMCFLVTCGHPGRSQFMLASSLYRMSG